MKTPQQHNLRLDYLDAVRAYALILGIIFHASLSFMPMFIGWAVVDISTSDLVPMFVLVSHSFRMALFFLIAGFFSHMTFHQQGSHVFFKSRLVRIGIPFIIGWLLLRPLLVSGWAMGAESMRGDVDVVNGLLIGFNSLGQLPNELLVGTHLWFLYYLLLISFSVIAIRFVVNLNEPIKNALNQLLDKVISWVCKSRFSVIAAAIPMCGCLWFMSHWGIDTPDKSLIPITPVALLYGGFFVFGWLLHRQSILIETLANITLGRLVLCAFAIVVALLLSRFETQTGHPQYLLIKVCFLASYAIMIWSMILLSIGISKRIFSRPSKVIRYVADASYWLYLIHLPIVIWLQIAFAELPLHWSIKLGLVSAITLFVSILIYDLLVRSTWLGALLNGKRKDRFLLLTKLGRTQPT